MVVEMIVINKEFYDEEIRNNYKISNKMKKVWAIQLDMLSSLEQICEKYGLKYYADSGTLIGAVRHQGYIPWDDDIDLVMMREDYNKLLEVAEEFEYPLFLQSAYSEERYIRGHAQLRNSATTGCTLEDYNKNINKGIFIDIFPLDNVPDNKIELKMHSAYLKLLFKLMHCGIYYDINPNNSLKRKIVGHAMYIVFKFIDYKRMFRYYERLCSKYNNIDTQNVSYIEYSHGKEKHIWKKEWFNDVQRVPFEFTTIVIPKGYNERLEKEYGDYMEIKEVPTSHGELILEPDVSYADYFREK